MESCKHDSLQLESVVNVNDLHNNNNDDTAGVVNMTDHNWRVVDMTHYSWIVGNMSDYIRRDEALIHHELLTE